ncbi:MAG: hypothetical protein JEZ00_09295 [Anaerolineaceae bacterium]|nr:hypothetical protein [Anaerolineaceae bacterium]
MLIQLKNEIQKANGQIRMSELSQKLQVTPSVIEGMLISLYGKDVLNSHMDSCKDSIVCTTCAGSCPFSKSH